MAGIFISYRREDSPGHAGRLFDRLRDRLGRDRVFMDITGIGAGLDFVETLERAIGSCDVLIAVIGPAWLTCTDTAGRPRLADPGDFIRIEIATALRRRVPVIPVLVGGATMPLSSALPSDLAALARRQAAELRDTHWDADFDELVRGLEPAPAASHVGAGPPPLDDLPLTRPRTPAHPPAGPPAAFTSSAPRRVTTARRRTGRWLVAGAAVAVTLLAGWIAVGRLGTPWRTPDLPVQADEPVAPAPAAVPAPPPRAPVQPLRTETPARPSAGGAAPRPGSSIGASSVSPGRALPLVRVPPLVGLSLENASRALREAGLVLGATARAPRDAAAGVAGGSVTAQSPPAGSPVRTGSAVDLVYVERVRTVAVPTVVGLDLAATRARLERQGLVLRARRITVSTDAPPGRVVSQAPDAGGQVEPGSGVDVTFAGRIAPAVKGRSLRDAQAVLEGIGLTFRVGYEVDPKAPPGTVVRQVPLAGTTIVDDRAVELAVARPPVVSPVVYVRDEVDEASASRVIASWRGLKMGRPRVVRSSRRPGPAGIIFFHASEHERLAREMAARAESQLSGEGATPATFQIRFVDSAARWGSIYVWLPDRDRR